MSQELNNNLAVDEVQGRLPSIAKRVYCANADAFQFETLMAHANSGSTWPA